MAAGNGQPSEGAPPLFEVGNGVAASSTKQATRASASLWCVLRFGVG